MGYSNLVEFSLSVAESIDEEEPNSSPEAYH
ncbi:uncharacterized protein G2W53_003684 [Senna tora]|uniref:Uncharacterized protein n=1 Tax=Senna tora TaxID=362788 RepID=A0A834XAE8_9FABA|nr:uncharacterized protein G2W53_003684 [Senna tora]